MKKVKTSLFILLFLILMVMVNGQEVFKYQTYTKLRYLIHQNKLSEAEKLVSGFLARYPDNPLILAEKSFLTWQMGQNRNEAKKILDRSLDLDPGYFYSNYLYATLLYDEYQEKNGNEEMLERILKFLRLSILDNSQYFNSQFMAGQVYRRKGDLARSNKHLEAALKISNTPEAWYYLGSNKLKLGQTDEALSAFQKLLQLIPRSPQAMQAISAIYMEKKDYLTALKYLEILFEQEPRNKKVVFDYLFALFSAGRFDKFMKVSQKTDLSKFPFLQWAKALVLVELNRSEQALEQLARIKVRDYKTKLLLARVHVQLQNYYDSYLVLQQVPIKERNQMFYSLLLNTLSYLDLKNQIIKTFSQIRERNLQLNGFELFDFYPVIIAYIDLRGFSELIDLIAFIDASLPRGNNILTDLKNGILQLKSKKKLSKKFISHEANLYPLVLLFKKLNKNRGMGRVEKFLKKLLEGEPRISHYLLLADFYYDYKKYSKLEKLIKKAQKLFPGSLILKNYQAYYLAVTGKNLDEALELSQTTIHEDQHNPAYLDTFGYLLFKLGRTDEAGNYLLQAYQKHPFDREIIDHLVRLYEKQNQVGKIIEIYQKALNHKVDFALEINKKLKNVQNKKDPD